MVMAFQRLVHCKDHTLACPKCHRGFGFTPKADSLHATSKNMLLSRNAVSDISGCHFVRRDAFEGTKGQHFLREQHLCLSVRAYMSFRSVNHFSHTVGDNRVMRLHSPSEKPHNVQNCQRRTKNH